MKKKRKKKKKWQLSLLIVVRVSAAISEKIRSVPRHYAPIKIATRSVATIGLEPSIPSSNPTPFGCFVVLFFCDGVRLGRIWNGCGTDVERE